MPGSLTAADALQDVVDGIEELQRHQTAMDKIPLMVSMEKIPPQMTQTLMQVFTARHFFLQCSDLCTLLDVVHLPDPFGIPQSLKLQHIHCADPLLLMLCGICRK